MITYSTEVQPISSLVTRSVYVLSTREPKEKPALPSVIVSAAPIRSASKKLLSVELKSSKVYELGSSEAIILAVMSKTAPVPLSVHPESWM